MDEKSIGRKIRQIRIAKNMTLAQLSSEIEKTRSYLSQVERGLIEPSIKALRLISKALDVPMFYFLMDNKNHRGIVRKEDRKRLNFSGSRLTYELLSPDLNHEMEVVQVTLEPDSSTYDEPISHKGEEFILILQGRMEIQLQDEFFTLREGDSIYFMGSIPHKTTNIGESRLTFISAITPPHF